EEMLRLKEAINKTILFVTHDVEEALRLADKIVVLREGRVEQYDTPFKILTEPANAFVRELVGGDDMVRQLSLVRVSQAMTLLPQTLALDGIPTIDVNDDLRMALSKLLRSGRDSLVVVDQDKPI